MKALSWRGFACCITSCIRNPSSFSLQSDRLCQDQRLTQCLHAWRALLCFGPYPLREACQPHFTVTRLALLHDESHASRSVRKDARSNKIHERMPCSLDLLDRASPSAVALGFRKAGNLDNAEKTNDRCDRCSTSVRSCLGRYDGMQNH